MLEVDDGRLVLGSPVEAAVVRAMAAVRRDLSSRGEPWRELDGRFRGWVVVRGLSGRGRPAARGRRERAVALVSERYPGSGGTNAAAVGWLSSGAA